MVAAAALACGGLALTGGVASAAPLSSSATAALKLSTPLRSATGPIAAFIRTTGDGALAVDAAAKGGDLTRSRTPSAAATQRVSAIEKTTDAVTDAVKSGDGAADELYSTAYTVPGVAVVADASVLREIAKRSDVQSILPLTSKTISDPTEVADGAAPSGVDPDMVRPGADGVSPKNAASDIYTRSLDAWQQTGKTGKGVNIAVIDTGLDYTQADFGGPGTVAAYDAALANTAAPTAGSYDGAKFLGGYDFAGPTYNADDTDPSTYDPTPAPDDNPIDGRGGEHGTHVSGTAAGYGLNADKTTFDGDYTKLTNQGIQDMYIGPGTAPEAGLYALKVFGDAGGSTNLTGAALDWVGQALTEGKDINVINLSLGSDYGAPDDPDNAKIDALTARGVLPVIANGNADDFTDIGGSPGNAEGALTVAAAATGQSLFDAVAVTAPSDKTGNVRAQYSQNYQGTLPVEGDVVVPSAADPDGCTPFGADDAAAIAGKVVWLKWTDGALECGSGVRFNNVAAAGGVGVLLAGTVNSFDSGIAGNTTIPGAELTLDAVTSLQAAATAGTLHVQFRDDLKGSELATDADSVNTLASFTSRGVHGSFDQIVKPDIAAPGVNVISAASGTGDGRLSLSGTSMATPHTAGIAALTFESHPTWSAPDVKAALMNTATHDVQDGGQDANLLRQGTGRVDALQAVTAGTTVRSVQNDQLVTASFGVVGVQGATTQTRTLQIKNTDGRPHTYDVAYQGRVDQPGVTFSVSTKRVTVVPHGTATVTLTMSIPDPTALRKVIDPTQDAVQSGYDREFVAAATGLVTFTPTDPKYNPLRLATFAAPKPVSSVQGSDVVFTDQDTSAAIALTGTSFAQGTGTSAYTALAAPFVLGGNDPAESFPEGSAKQSLEAADIRTFGASADTAGLADKSTGVVSFGVQTNGPDANPGAVTNVEVLIDTDKDGTPDFLTYDSKSAVVDATFATTIDLATGAVVDAEPLNGGAPGQDVNTFDSSVKVLPVALSALGYSAGSTDTSFDYSVQTESQYAPSLATSGDYVVDSTSTATFDPYAPALWFTQGDATGPLFTDSGSITVHRATPVSSAATDARILLLHLHNATDNQSQVLATSTKVTTPVTPTVTLKPGSAVTITGVTKVGHRLAAHHGSWNANGVKYTYQWLLDGSPIRRATDATYTLKSHDKGHTVSVTVTASAKGYKSGTATSAPTAVIAKK
jgi:subtilisin family serine protease